MSSIQKVEIVSPAVSTELAPRTLGRLLFGLSLRVLVVWWFVATWFPELGLTYWGLVLPVWIASWVFTHNSGRHIPEKLLKRVRWRNLDTLEVEEHLTELQPQKKCREKDCCTEEA